MTLLRLIGRRLVWALITLWLVSVFIFMAVELMPGDAAEALLGKDATPQAVENLRRALRCHAVRAAHVWPGTVK